jgi:hypothetical protein
MVLRFLQFMVPAVALTKVGMWQRISSIPYTAEHIPGARFVGYSTGGHLLVGHRNEVKRGLAEF